MDCNTKEEIRAVIANAANVFVASVDENGYPNVKAMFARMQEGMVLHYMSTNYSSKRTQQFYRMTNAVFTIVRNSPLRE